MCKNLIILFLSAFLSITTFAQKSAKPANAFEGLVKQAIAKAYPASVLMWEIDAATGNRMSAQFSGVVVTKEGFVLSAAHVVRNDHSYQVMFPDGKVATAKGLGRIAFPPDNMVPDAAMLKLNGDGPWPFAPMGSSYGLLVGQPCISIAYPETVEQRKPNVRLGEIKVLKNEYGFIESSCLMEPGDSGGPLFDLDGKVIGIHSGIRESEQVNYEVPVDTYRKFWNALTKPADYTSLPKDSILLDALANSKSGPGIALKKDEVKQFGKADRNTIRTCVTISSTLDGRMQTVIGTLIAQDGLPGKKDPKSTLIISKNSMVGTDAEISLAKGGWQEFGLKRPGLQVIARDKKHDLVLLKLSARMGEEAVSLKHAKADSIAPLELGTLLLSQVNGTAVWGALGSQYITLPPKSSYGYIGAATGLKGDKLVFTIVQPNSAAADAGIKVGDAVVQIGNTKPEDELDFVKALTGKMAGDTVTINTIADGKPVQRTVILKYPPQRKSNHPAEHFAGGKSIRRDGFKDVFIQDAIIKPEQCGSPVFDLKGNFMGINIARLSRTSTVVVPAAALRKFVIDNLTK
ncbi:trypsin-like peptidase domain-containing protein [Mucilaginibacter myungsuensis]|uniref:Trypsin-like peptidase domain-containing protein n=1 Tax=Mucilaginibacter myungsuensis TaxID=649104 RepID=A0A929L009_9SPHI|nr:trypsin-like peptidase domain-containing protein [Mucilaginibacter myungsuensis]MBE9660796.1 trypsin-like peptidase domain-containing protein [Mucilaginibacter myungsuensis]MDN3600842.1 trypsin-like peptidase domain-containing protein [Mucilaginibacter myungsuensis]